MEKLRDIYECYFFWLCCHRHFDFNVSYNGHIWTFVQAHLTILNARIYDATLSGAPTTTNTKTGKPTISKSLHAFQPSFYSLFLDPGATFSAFCDHQPVLVKNYKLIINFHECIHLDLIDKLSHLHNQVKEFNIKNIMFWKLICDRFQHVMVLISQWWCQGSNILPTSPNLLLSLVKGKGLIGLLMNIIFYLISASSFFLSFNMLLPRINFSSLCIQILRDHPPVSILYINIVFICQNVKPAFS